MKISQSIHEILNRDDVVADLFYDIFLDRHPDVQQYFVGVDLKQQAILLTMMLSVIEEYYTHTYSTTARYLKIVGQKHKALGIPSALFPSFGQCLLETLQRFHGTEWDAELHSQWTEGIEKASRVLLEGY